jgi:catechol 2,3-dioxygenase-like lactoylglutathione lyase family enzyme|tara:strand:- start:95 stop:676 length:582 start_codon:yes stop_codon:yes gene_type:complete
LKIVLFALIVLVSNFPTAGYGQEIPEGFSVSPMNRATIFVRNLDESLRLYRDLLGLRVLIDLRTDGDEINEIMGTQGSALRAVILQSGDSLLGNIGIYEIIGDDRTALSPPSVYANIVTGDVAVVFLTNDIDGITNQLRNAGYLLISPPMVLYAREDAQVQDREMLFRDRDGVLVNLIEFGNPRPEWSMPASE